MQPSEQTSPHLVPNSLPANPVSIADGLAAVTISPFTRDLTEAERTAILAADRQRIFVRACGFCSCSLTTGSFAPVKFSDYPFDTMSWCIAHSSLLCVGLVECSNPSEKDVEALLSQFDSDDVADHRFVIRVILDARSGVADDWWYQRPPPIVSIKQASVKEAAQ
jgi:hypothetical protein